MTPRRLPGPRRSPSARAACALLLAVLALAALVRPAAALPERAITLTLAKAQAIELPVDVSDVLVANPDIADVVVKTPRQVYLIANKAGDTNAFFLDESGRQVLKLDIRVEMELGALRQALASLVPGADVEVRAVNQNIVLTGAVPSAVAAENIRQIARRFVDDDAKVINMLQITSGQQVVIRVRVAEMRRTVAKQLGIDLIARDGNVRVTTGGSGGFPLTVDPTTGGLSGTGQFFGRFGAVGYTGTPFGLDRLTATLEALEEDGLVKTLAEPNLTALSGESASFLAGGEFPVPTARDSSSGDGTQVTIEFKPFGIALRFTPVVLSSGRISMKISTEVSDLSNEGAITLADLTIPALAVRRAETTVEIPSGGSLVLAGLLRNDAADTVRGLPGLANLPVLGALFRSVDFQRDETELVVVATPYIVRPTSPDQILLPTDGFAPASDIDLYLLGRLYSRYPQAGPAPATAPARPIGYIME